MRRTHVIGAVAAVAITALVVWIARNTYWEEYEENGSPQGEALVNPFYAAQRLTELLGAKAHARHDIVRLPPQDAVIVLGNWYWSLMPERRQRLEKWVSDGGHLIASKGYLSDKTFTTWTGVRETRSSLPKTRVTPPGDKIGTGSRSFTICPLSESTYLATTRATSWRLNDGLGHAQVLRVPMGRGSVTIVNTVPFTYQTMLCGDNPQFFAAATELHKGMQIEFLTEEEGRASLPGLAWRYGSPVIVLTGLLIALWLWRSGARFGPLIATPDSARRSLAEQIRGTGQFTLRFGGGRALYAATLRALNEAATRRVPHYERLSAEERVATLAPLTGFDPSELSAALKTGGRSSHELCKAIAVLETARRHIGRVGHAD